jgi:hypothetical protein
MPTYSTRVLTARDAKLLDALRKHPRYQGLAERLSPTAPPKPPAPSKPPPAPAPAPKGKGKAQQPDLFEG